MSSKTALFQRIVRQSGIYALGNIALKASGLVLALIYLNPAYLAVKEFGYFSLLIVTAQLGVFVVGLGLGTGMLKFMTDPDYEDRHDELPFTALSTTVVGSIVALVVLWLLSAPLASWLLDDASRSSLLTLMAVYVVFKVIGGIPMMLLRVKERAGWYVLAMVAEVLVLLGGAYYLLVVQGWGLTGLMTAYTISAGVGAVVLVGVMLKQVSWRFDQKLVGVLIRFGFPLVLASFAGWFLNAGDRYLLKWLTDAETVGLYEWAARLAGVLNMLFVQSFNLAFAVIGLKALGDRNSDGQVHQETLRHYIIWTGWAALGLSLLAYDVTNILPADPIYLQAESLVLLLALGFMAYGVYYVIINILYASGRTKAVSMNVVAAAVLNALLNIVMIPFWGALGAAVATFAAYLALGVGASYFAKQESRVRFPWRVFSLVIFTICGLYFLGRPSLDWSMEARLGIRILIIAIYPIGMLALRLYTVQDLQKGWRLAQTWMQQDKGAPAVKEMRNTEHDSDLGSTSS